MMLEARRTGGAGGIAALLVAAALAAVPAAAQQVTGVPGSPSATTTIDGKQLPTPPPKFGGVIKESVKQSKTWWPPRVVPPKGAPNVLLIMTDDQGYGVSGTFGGVIPTPALDRIANTGLRYTQFHSTALCSPTRAALITGRNHHSVGFGVIAEHVDRLSRATTASSARTTPPIGDDPRDNGYATSWFGKNHNTPTFQYSLAGPFDQWPVGHGLRVFLRFHGRRDRPVDALPVPGSHAGLSVDRQARLQPHHRHGGRSDRLYGAAQRSRARQAILRLLCSRRNATRRTSRRRSGSTSSRASSTWAGMPCASRSLPIRSGWA